MPTIPPPIARWLVKEGLAPMFWRRIPGAVTWRGRALRPATIHHGALRQPEALPDILDNLDADPARLALIDLDGQMPPLGDRFDGALLIRPPQLASLDELALIAGLRGAFDLILVVFESSSLRPPQEGLRLIEMARRLPPRPWVALGLGDLGYRGGILNTLRGQGSPSL